MISKINFNGFRFFVEEEEKSDESGFSKFANSIKKNFNIDIDDVIDKVGGITLSPNIMTFQTGSKEGDKQDGIKIYEIVNINKNKKTVTIKDVTGECDKDGGNKDNPSAQCSTTNGKTYVISKQQFDWLIAHVSGQGGGGMGGGGMGGGGMGGGPPMGGI